MTTVNCKRKDARMPKKIGGLMLLSSPLDVDLKEGDKLTIGLGLSFDVPVLVMEYDALKLEGVNAVGLPRVFYPGQDIVVNLEKSGGPVTFVEVGRALVTAVPLADSYDLKDA